MVWWNKTNLLSLINTTQKAGKASISYAPHPQVPCVLISLSSHCEYVLTFPFHRSQGSKHWENCRFSQQGEGTQYRKDPYGSLVTEPPHTGGGLREPCMWQIEEAFVKVKLSLSLTSSELHAPDLVLQGHKENTEAQRGQRPWWENTLTRPMGHQPRTPQSPILNASASIA